MYRNLRNFLVDWMWDMIKKGFKDDYKGLSLRNYKNLPLTEMRKLRGALLAEAFQEVNIGNVKLEIN